MSFNECYDVSTYICGTNYKSNNYNFSEKF